MTWKVQTTASPAGFNDPQDGLFDLDLSVEYKEKALLAPEDNHDARLVALERDFLIPERLNLGSKAKLLIVPTATSCQDFATQSREVSDWTATSYFSTTKKTRNPATA